MKLHRILLPLLCLCLLAATSLAEPIAVGTIAASGQIHEQGDALTLRYDLRLPELRSPQAAAINGAYVELLAYYQSDYITMLYNEQRKDWKEANIPIEVNLDFDVKLNDGVTISLVICDGTALGDQLTENYTAETYSMVDGRQLTLSDIIQTHEPVIVAAAREIARQIDEARKTDNVWNYYADVDADIVSLFLSETSFYLREDGALVLILNPVGISESTSGLCEFVWNLDNLAK